MINIITKINKYFILSIFLIAIIAVQFGFLNSLTIFNLYSIDLFLILIILISVSTKKINKIIFPVFIISLISSIYSDYNVLILVFSYLISSVVIFYLNNGPLFISGYYRFALLIIVSVLSFKILFYFALFVFGFIYYKTNILPNIDVNFLTSLIAQIVYSLLILFLFKPDIKYINYEFLVGD